MTVLVSVKINDGVVMAADSASSFASGLIYHHAQKIVNLTKGLPIGAMVTGAGGIGNESIDTLLKDLRRRFSGRDPAYSSWKLDPATYTVEQVSIRVRAFLFEEKSRPHRADVWTKVRICGYSAGRPLAEVWEVQLEGAECAPPRQVQAEQEFGPRWDGEYEALDRLIFGLGTRFNEASMKHGLTLAQAAEAREKLAPELYELLFLEAMPIQDAVDLARFLVQTTIGFVKFSVSRAKTVGGPIEIAAITKHEGFKWIERRHFYPSGLNGSEEPSASVVP
jgi:20S proteasome alpha/beta subunit